MSLSSRGSGAYRLLGGALLVVAVALANALKSTQQREKLLSFFSLDDASPGAIALTIVLFLVVVPIVGYVAVEILRRGRQMRTNVLVPHPMAQGLIFEIQDQQNRTVGSIDARTAVLYLRSFGQDTVTAESRTRGVNQFLSELKTEEEQLAATVKPVGPMVAIGRPGESLPELGALRMYVTDDEWQSVVTSWLTCARLVVLRIAGNTEGLLWEIAQAPRCVAPERLVLLLPLKRAPYQVFRDRAQQFFPRGLPDYREKWYDVLKRRGLMGLVYFEQDWTPQFVRIRPLLLTFESRNLVKAVLKSALRPVFAQLGHGPEVEERPLRT